jgi:hypothetical protein
VTSEELGASDDYVNEALWRTLRAKVLASRGDFDQAEALARAAVEIAARTDFLDLRGQMWLDLAGVLRVADLPGSREAATEALALYARKGNLVGAARTKAAAALTTASA